MEESAEQPRRRVVLVLMGAGVLAPAAFAVLPLASSGGEVDGLRFDVLEVGRHAMAGHSRPVGPVPLAEQASWPDVVRVQLRVRNLAALPLLVSPGQFRLRVNGDLSVMPTAWLHGATALGGGATRTGWIDFRAPDVAGYFRLEFSAAGRPQPVSVRLAVPRRVA